MLDAPSQKELVESLAKSFTAEDIDELGRVVLGRFSAESRLGLQAHVTVPVRDAAAVLLDEAREKNKLAQLIQVVVEADGRPLRGRTVSVSGLEEFLAGLSRAGWVYDYKKRKLRHLRGDEDDLPNWGALKEGREYRVTVASVDIVGNSQLVAEHGNRTVKKLYYRFWEFLRRTLAVYDGRIWSWAGDGGVIAFAFKHQCPRAVRWSLELQRLMALFNTTTSDLVDGDISVRVALDTGDVVFHDDAGEIVSETINFAAHLEKMYTDPGTVSISRAVYEELDEKLGAFFQSGGTFEGRAVFRSSLQDEHAADGSGISSGNHTAEHATEPEPGSKPAV
jgi:class 3 adenylate cyclase